MQTYAMEKLVGGDQGEDSHGDGKHHRIRKKEDGHEHKAERDHTGQYAFEHGIYLSF
jgi:hypothetical protein